jgi:hypothetical protein
MKKGICLVGLGPHAKRIYYKYIEQEVLEGRLEFEMVIDLESKKEDIAKYCETQKICPKKVLLCADKDQLVPKKLDPSIEGELNEAIKNNKIHYAIVATEPKAHKIYIEYFLKNKIPVLTDKPPTAPTGLNYDEDSAEELYTDAKYLSELSIKMKTPLYVLVQRREHPAYMSIFSEALKVVKEYGVPITFFNVYHSDGQWNMPEEYLTRENHPYKYGYGKIMHSGYHFIDIVSWIAETNKTILPKLYISNRTELIRPHTHYRQIRSQKLLKRLFNKETVEPSNIKMGEVDSYTNFFFRDGELPEDRENVVTFGHLDMLQSGFSGRAWYDLPRDTYKGNGRLRHEYINLHIGPMFNIQLHSYQSARSDEHSKFDVGGMEHQEVNFFRNDKLIGGKPFETVNFGKDIRDKYSSDLPQYLGQNEASRYVIFKKLLNGEDSSTLIENQLLTNEITSNMFLSAIRGDEQTFKI